MLGLPPLALYAHFPWCVQKCPYCDFNSYALKDPLPEERYVDTLLADLGAQRPRAAQPRLVSIFLGGGTPSLFSPAAIARFLSGARALFAVDAALEVTLEANPGTIERGRFAEYRAAGVTRVSLGAQTFDAGRLESLGRIHSPDETRRAAEELHAAGLPNFNLDLMYGLPGQTPADAVRDIDSALALEPQHVSHYQLTIEPGTVFAGRPPTLPDDDAIEAMLADCQARLFAAGFARYEVSAYARDGARCAHNLNYWRFGDYLGVGAGAHGKLTRMASGSIVRTQHAREPRRYLAAAAGAASESLVAAEQLPFEYMLNALRLVQGVDASEFEARTGLERQVVAGTLARLADRGLVVLEGERWRASERGFRFLNNALVEFLPADTPAASVAIPINER
jgi:oxygen-independent coproporphyrinogen-3 oxidase